MDNVIYYKDTLNKKREILYDHFSGGHDDKLIRQLSKLNEWETNEVFPIWVGDET